MLNKNDTVLIIAHYTQLEDRIKSIGPPQDLKRFLLQRVRKITYILLPFPNAVDKRCYIDIYENGKLVATQKSFRLIGPDWLQYLMHPFLIQYYSIINSFHTACFALDNLSCISVLPLRISRLIGKLIYYSVDYTPKRFENRILNFIYQKSDKIACATADINWVLSKPMRRIKKTKKFFLGTKAIFYEVPMGFPKKEITILPTKKIDRFHLVFAGTLLEKQGVQLILESLPKLLRYYPKLHLTIIGSGDYEDTLKKITKENKLNNAVDFKGFIANHRQIEAILTQSAVGLAPYKPNPDSYTYFADPMKPKIYLGCGLPIVITNVPPIAKVIEKHGAGIIMNYSEESFIASIKRILGDSGTYSKYRNEAIKLAEKYDTEKILSSVLSKTF